MGKSSMAGVYPELAWIKTPIRRYISGPAGARERPEWALRPIRRKTAAAEVPIELPLDVVGDPPTVPGDETPRLLLDAALPRTLDGCQKALEDASTRVRRRVCRCRPARRGQVKVPVCSNAAHVRPPLLRDADLALCYAQSVV